MSNSIQTYCYQDDSYFDPNRTRSIYMQMDNGLQINLTNSNITALCPIFRDDANNISNPQQSILSSNNDQAAIGFITDHATKNRYRHIDNGADVITRANPEAKYNELHNTINGNIYFSEPTPEPNNSSSNSHF